LKDISGVNSLLNFVGVHTVAGKDVDEWCGKLISEGLKGCPTMKKWAPSSYK